MNESKSDSPTSECGCIFRSLDSVILWYDAKGDSTPQPRPAYVPRDWPPQARQRPPSFQATQQAPEQAGPP